MIDAKMIPDEVVEAAIKELDNPAAEDVVGFDEDMRAAIAAGLTAWKGAGTNGCDPLTKPDRLILPLPQKDKSDE